MEYLLTPYAKPYPPYAKWVDAFTENELLYLQDKAKNAEQNSAIFGNRQDSNVRRSKVTWLYNTPENKFVFQKLAHVASKLNSEFYGFDLTGFGEPLQLTNYDQLEKGMYGWHADMGANISRKLSLVVQLTDPSEYEGGNLQLFSDKEPLNIEKRRGLICAFPSFTMHQVTEVTKGTRQSLVVWLSGPPFK